MSLTRRDRYLTTKLEVPTSTYNLSSVSSQVIHITSTTTLALQCHLYGIMILQCHLYGIGALQNHYTVWWPFLSSIRYIGSTSIVW